MAVATRLHKKMKHFSPASAMAAGVVEKQLARGLRRRLQRRLTRIDTADDWPASPTVVRSRFVMKRAFPRHAAEIPGEALFRCSPVR